MLASVAKILQRTHTESGGVNKEMEGWMIRGNLEPPSSDDDDDEIGDE